MGERLRKRGAGSWEGRVREPSGWVWRSTGAKDKGAARKILAEWERVAADPALAAEATATLDRALGAYLASRKARGRSEATLRYYSGKAGPLVRLLPERLAALDHAGLEAYLSQRVGEGATKSTVRKEFGLLGSALRLARKSGTFARDPAALLPEVEDSYRPRLRALSPWELVALACALPPPRAAHVVWIVATGARWGESLRAEREDCGPELVRLRGTKTALSARSVPVLRLTRPLLSWALQRAGEGRLFARWTNVLRDLARACEAAQIPPCTPNDLRRTLSTWLRGAGVEPSQIAVLLGHVDSRMAEKVYARLGPSELGALLDARLGARVPPASHADAGHVPSGPLWSAWQGQDLPVDPRFVGGPTGTRTRDLRIKRPKESSKHRPFLADSRSVVPPSSHAPIVAELAMYDVLERAMLAGEWPCLGGEA